MKKLQGNQRQMMPNCSFFLSFNLHNYFSMFLQKNFVQSTINLAMQFFLYIGMCEKSGV